MTIGRSKLLSPSIALIFLLVLIAALAAGCGDETGQTGASTAGTEAVAPLKTDVIVFIRDGQVWAVNPNNGAERQVTSDATTKVWPRVSPDGTQVVYQVVTADSGSTGGIYRVALDGSGSPEVINQLGSYPAWSIDGKSIACVAKNPGTGEQQVDDIVIMDAANPGAGPAALTDHKNIVDSGGPLAVQNLEYSPDGKYIYFMRGRRSDSRWLARVNVDTRIEDDVQTPPGSMPEGLAEGGFSLFNVSEMEGRRALVSRGNLGAGNFQTGHQLYIRFLDPPGEDSPIEDTQGSINPSLKPDNTRFVYENNGILNKHNLAGSPGLQTITTGSMPDWGMSAVGPGFGTDGGTDTTKTTGTTGGEDGTGGDTTDACGGPPLPGRELLVNGDFEAGLNGWQTIDIKKKGVNTVQVVSDAACGKALAFSRTDSRNDGGMSAVSQDLSVTRAGLSALYLRLVGAIDSQDLDGDGRYGGETPLFVTVDYTTAGGQAKTWTHGFMAYGPVNYPERDQLIPGGGQWYRWDCPELLATLPDLQTITRITIGGSGWDFSSRMGLISLTGE